MNQKVFETFLELMNQCRVRNCIEYGNDLRVFGKPVTVNLTRIKRHVVQQLVGNISNTCFQGFDRFIYKHVLFHSSNYKRLQKRKNCVIQTEQGMFMQISRLIVVPTDSQNGKYVIIGTELKQENETLSTNRNPLYNSQRYSFIARETTTITCCTVESIKMKCIDIDHPMSFR